MNCNEPDFKEHIKSVCEETMLEPVFDGVERIARARDKQKEKYNTEHDDTHDTGVLAINAAMLALRDTSFEVASCFNGFRPRGWQLHRKYLDRIEQLEVAGALIAAEIDRLLRLEDSGASG